MDIRFEQVGDKTELIFQEFPNDYGIIFRISAVLYFHDFTLDKVSVATDKSGNVHDRFLIDSTPQKPDGKTIEKIRSDLVKLFKKEISALSYLAANPDKMKHLHGTRQRSQKPKVEMTPCRKENCSQITIEASDRPGLFVEITQLFYLLYIDIISIETEKKGDIVFIRIEAKRENDKPFDDFIKDRIIESLHKIL